MKSKLSPFIVTALALACFSYTPRPVSAQDSSGQSVVACPGQGTLPTGKYSFVIYIAHDDFLTPQTANAHIGQSSRHERLMNEIDATYYCKNASSACVNQRPCTKQSVVNNQNIIISTVTSGTTYSSISSWEAAHAKDLTFQTGAFVGPTVCDTKVTFIVDLGQGNTSNCECPF